MKEAKLGKFLSEVANWRWDEFCLAENDEAYTTNESVIFALIRSCVMERMDAIRLSLGRLDGKLVTPIRVEYPKIYFLYPNATAIAGPEPVTNLPVYQTTADKPPVPTREIVAHEPEVEEAVDLEKLSLTEAIALMGTLPRQLPRHIVKAALATEMWLNNQGKKPPEIPMVKSVIAAHLLTLAQKRDIGALTEVFDRVEGKLVETFQVMGDNIYITNYSAFAPPGAEKNDDGVLQVEATQAQDLWASKLKKEA